MIYDINGNLLSVGGANLDGYTMETEPQWTESKCIVTDSPNVAVGNVGVATSALKASDFIPVMGRNTLLIPLPHVSTAKPVDYGVCFYDINKQALANYATNCFWNRQSGEAKVDTAEVFVPQNAVYFRTTYWSNSQSDVPTFTYTFTPGVFAETAITHEMPANRGMENAIRRARQLTDIKWTPLVNVPRPCLMNNSTVHFLDKCESGKEYTGIPYSGSGQTNNWQYGVIDPNSDSGKWGYLMFFVGLEVDFETFVTASRYANSIFGERANMQTYESVDCSIYGAVCTALLSYALGLSMPIWPVYSYMSDENYGKYYFNSIGQIGVDLAISDLRLGDVFHNSTHVAIITDIVRNAEGSIVSVEISEATTAGNASNGGPEGTPLGGICRRRAYTADYLATSGWATAYQVYRYKNFTGIPYTPSTFVDTGREMNSLPAVDMPCIPYLGNKARYKAGYIVNTKVLIGATGFTNLVVKKDGASFGTFALNGATEISVGFSATGSYEAYLTGANNTRSASCFWTVE